MKNVWGYYLLDKPMIVIKIITHHAERSLDKLAEIRKLIPSACSLSSASSRILNLLFLHHLIHGPVSGVSQVNRGAPPQLTPLPLNAWVFQRINHSHGLRKPRERL